MKTEMKNKGDSMNEIEINGEVFVKKSDIKSEATELDGMKYQIVRTNRAGVFAAYVEKRDGSEAVLINARRLWQWAGAASLSQLAMEGVSSPEGCKFPCEVDRITVLGVIEVLDCTEVARLNIAQVPAWKS